MFEDKELRRTRGRMVLARLLFISYPIDRAAECRKV